MKRIKITYTMTAPVSHIGETASTGSYFQTVATAYGRLPVITGNSVRGILRDCAALHFMTAYGSPVNRDIFNVLFSGGNITGAAENDVGRAKQVREHFPMISLFGAGLGSMMMSGNLISGFLYPICLEAEPITGIGSEISWHDLIEEIEFTRMDDGKEDKNEKYLDDPAAEKSAKASTQMRFGVQYMAPGTKFIQEIILADGVTELEEGAFWAAVAKWFEIPAIGGMRAKGFGKFNAVSDEISVTDGVITMSDRVNELIAKYNDFLYSDTPSEWIYLLDGNEKKGAKKNGKRAVPSAESDG